MTEWSHSKNQKRCDLIDKEISGNITSEEQTELDRLQNEMIEWRMKIAPLPLKELREMLTKPTSFFCCPPTTCKCNCICGTERTDHVCEHKWDGKEEVIDNGASATCSKCGMLAISHDMQCLP